MSGCYSSQQVEKVGQNSLTECFETRKSYFSQDKVRETLPFEEMILFKKNYVIQTTESHFPCSLGTAGLLGKWQNGLLWRNYECMRQEETQSDKRVFYLLTAYETCPWVCVLSFNLIIYFITQTKTLLKGSQCSGLAKYLQIIDIFTNPQRTWCGLLILCFCP